MRIIFRLRLVLLALLCACVMVRAGYSQERLNSMNKEYVLSPNDTIEITVFGEPELSLSVRIPQNGSFSYPLLGTLKAAGLTVRELENTIYTLLEKDYLVSPQVTIFVKEFSKMSISVLGQVKAPGNFQVRDNFTLTQAFALAGGFTETADLSQVKIVRIQGAEKETIEVDVEDIMDRYASDIVLRPEDTIIVEEYGKFSIIGQVGRPGVYSLKKGLTVIEAISIAGGFTPTAAQNGTRLIRIDENGDKIIIPVPVASIIKSGDTRRDVELEVDDTIVVPESFF